MADRHLRHSPDRRRRRAGGCVSQSDQADGPPCLLSRGRGVGGRHRSLRATSAPRRRTDYPPLTVYVFRPLAQLEWRHAQQLWFLLKVVALIGFLWICHAYLVPLSGWSPATILFFAIGYNQAILLELRAGNVALFEQTFLLAGLAALVAKHYAWFIVLVLLAGQFKLVPLLYLALPLIVCRSIRQGIVWTVAGVTAAALYLVANILFFPVMFREFVAISRTLVDDSGLLNPSAYVFIRDVLSWLTGRSLSDVEGVAMGLFTVQAIVVAAISIAAMCARRRQPHPIGAR